MKRFILGGLSMVLLSAIAAPTVQAETQVQAEIAPFNLVSLANQGFFRNEGIPQYSRLMAAYRNGQVTSEDVVQAAIDANRLSQDTLNDKNYVLAVEQQLNNLYGTSDN